MNSPAIELYRSKGVDIEKEPLEIRLSAQHNNGGIAVDKWWQTSVEGLFAAGECAGTHGIARPGGSALNAGQAGSFRAAQYISAKKEENTDENAFSAALSEVADRHTALLKKIKGDENTGIIFLSKIRADFSEYAAAVRDYSAFEEIIERRKKALKNFPFLLTAKDTDGIVDIYRYLDALYTQYAVITSLKDYCEKTSLTRGSAIYINNPKNIPEEKLSHMIQEISLNGDDTFKINWRNVRPIPEDEGFFENVWQGFRENKNIY